MRSEALAKQHHDEDGGRERLELVRHLEDSGLEVSHGDEEGVVLHGVEQRRHGDLERVERLVEHVALDVGGGRVCEKGVPL